MQATTAGRAVRGGARHAALRVVRRALCAACRWPKITSHGLAARPRQRQQPGLAAPRGFGASGVRSVWSGRRAAPTTPGGPEGQSTARGGRAPGRSARPPPQPLVRGGALGPWGVPGRPLLGGGGGSARPARRPRAPASRAGGTAAGSPGAGFPRAEGEGAQAGGYARRAGAAEGGWMTGGSGGRPGHGFRNLKNARARGLRAR